MSSTIIFSKEMMLPWKISIGRMTKYKHCRSKLRIFPYRYPHCKVRCYNLQKNWKNQLKSMNSNQNNWFIKLNIFSSNWKKSIPFTKTNFKIKRNRSNSAFNKNFSITINPISKSNWFKILNINFIKSSI